MGFEGPKPPKNKKEKPKIDLVSETVPVLEELKARSSKLKPIETGELKPEDQEVLGETVRSILEK